jgi:hypothetical protein
MPYYIKTLEYMQDQICQTNAQYFPLYIRLSLDFITPICLALAEVFCMNYLSALNRAARALTEMN